MLSKTINNYISYKAPCHPVTCVHIHQQGKQSSYLENHLRHQGNIIRGMRENIFLERIIPIKAYPSPHSLALSLFTKAKFNKLKDLKIWVTEVSTFSLPLSQYLVLHRLQAMNTHCQGPTDLFSSHTNSPRSLQRSSKRAYPTPRRYQLERHGRVCLPCRL